MFCENNMILGSQIMCVVYKSFCFEPTINQFQGCWGLVQRGATLGWGVIHNGFSLLRLKEHGRWFEN